MTKAIVLLSGGLDSATTLYYALNKGYDVRALMFDYGQRHKKELACAKKLACHVKVPFEIVKITLPWKGSALLDSSLRVPKKLGTGSGGIPATYVPARNIIFMSFAASFAEAVGARVILIGANAIDYSGYPDCRPEFFAAYQKVLDRGLKAGVSGKKIRVELPLIRLTKAKIIALGQRLGVAYRMTWSCYNGGHRPCGTCDSCRLRARGFHDAGLSDPAIGK